MPFYSLITSLFSSRLPSHHLLDFTPPSALPMPSGDFCILLLLLNISSFSLFLPPFSNSPSFFLQAPPPFLSYCFFPFLYRLSSNFFLLFHRAPSASTLHSIPFATLALSNPCSFCLNSLASATTPFYQILCFLSLLAPLSALQKFVLNPFTLPALRLPPLTYTVFYVHSPLSLSPLLHFSLTLSLCYQNLLPVNHVSLLTHRKRKSQLWLLYYDRITINCYNKL